MLAEEKAIYNRMDKAIIDAMYNEGEIESFTTFWEGVGIYQDRHFEKYGVHFEI